MIYPLRKAIEFSLLPAGLFVVILFVFPNSPEDGSTLPGPHPDAWDVAEQIPPDRELRRRPVACCLNKSESVLIVANGRSGTLSAIQIDGGHLIGEWKLGESLTDLVRWRDDQLLAVDSAAGQLICIDFTNIEKPVARFRCATLAWPNRLVVDRANNRCYIGGLWSRQLSVVNLPNNLNSEVDVERLSAQVVNMPFSAGAMCLIDGETPVLLVLDDFYSR